MATNCGSYDVPPKLLSAPDDAWSARYTNMKHVAKLMRSFQQTGSVNESIKVVVTNDNLWLTHREGMLGTSLERYRDDMQGFITRFKFKLQAGNPAKRLADKYPKSKVWKLPATK